MMMVVVVVSVPRADRGGTDSHTSHDCMKQFLFVWQLLGFMRLDVTQMLNRL